MKEMIRRCFTVLLISLLLGKISAFHVYEHHEPDDRSDSHCEQCLIAIQGQQSEAFNFVIISLNDPPHFMVLKSTIGEVNHALAISVTPSILFSRPPPTMTT